MISKPTDLINTKKKPLKDQWTIDELIEQVIEGILDTGKNWTQTKPGVKAVWLKVARDYLDRLIAMAEKEEECND
jgi:hypothetical protein